MFNFNIFQDNQQLYFYYQTLCEKYEIPSAGFGKFQSSKDAMQYLEKVKAPYVVKASGLAAGKGVIICSDSQQAKQAIEGMMVKKAFGDAGD